MVNLVKQIEAENDQRKFQQPVAELNDLLDGKAHRLEQPPSAPNTKLQQEGVWQPALGTQIVAKHCFMY